MGSRPNKALGSNWGPVSATAEVSLILLIPPIRLAGQTARNGKPRSRIYDSHPACKPILCRFRIGPSARGADPSYKGWGCHCCTRGVYSLRNARRKLKVDFLQVLEQCERLATRFAGRQSDCQRGKSLGQCRNVQKQSRRSSSCFAMIVAEHSAESLTSFDSGVRFANGAERPQEAVF